jgi:hypothetical protein
MFMSNVTHKASRITPQQIEQIAAEGVTRALASRQAALAELSADEVEQVSGGKLPVPILAGMIERGEVVE